MMRLVDASHAVASRAAARVLPSQRRWRQLLESCTLTPDAATTTLDETALVVCGCPRSGTALMAATLFQPPHVVTAMEPWDALRLPPAEFFSSLRTELLGGELRRGRLRVDLLEANGDVEWQRDGEHHFPVDVHEDALIGVKWPTYWQLLGRLQGAKFVVCVRDPAEVARSFERQGGRLARGLDYEVAFNEQLNRTLLERYPTDAERRVGFYDAANSRVLAHADAPDVFVVRFERWFHDRAGLLDELSGFLDVDLTGTRVEIRPPDSVGNDREAARIRSTSTTAPELGYR